MPPFQHLSVSLYLSLSLSRLGRGRLEQGLNVMVDAITVLLNIQSTVNNANPTTEKVHGRARAPSRQTRRVAAKEVRSRVAPRKATDLFFIVSNGNF
jgi:hypothetical protein